MGTDTRNVPVVVILYPWLDKVYTDGAKISYYCHSPSNAIPGKPKNPSPKISFSVNRFSGSKPTPSESGVSGIKNWFAAVLAAGIVAGTEGLG